MRDLGENLRDRVRQRQDERPLGHALDQFRTQHPRSGQPEEDICTFDNVPQGAGIGVPRVTLPPGIHLRPALVDDAVAITDPDLLRVEAHSHEHVQAGDGRRSRARGHQLYVAERLAGHLETVGHRRSDNDRGAVLVVVEHGNAHAFAQCRFDLEALGGLDVLEIDATESRLEPSHGLDEALRVAFVDLYVEDVDAGELLEKNGLAFHDGLGREWTDRAETEHCAAVGDYRHQIAARREVRGLQRIFGDDIACRGHSGRVGERQILLCRQGFGRRYRELPGDRETMVVESLQIRHRMSSFRSGAGRIGAVPSRARL